MAEDAKTVSEVLKSGADFLKRKGVESPRLACELLVARLLNCKPLEIPLRQTTLLSGKYLDAMRRGIQRVGAGEPVQYVLGETEFMGHTFKVDRRALIPRLETEILVETVLACQALWARPKPAILDLGTGSGCIVISLALAKPNAFYIGLDPSADALTLAAENAEQLDVADRVTFAAEDLSDSMEAGMMDAIVANLPYVTTSEYEGLPRHIREFEPRPALDGGPTGLAIVETAVQDAAIVLKPGGFLFLEIGFTQGPRVAELLRLEGFQEVAIRKDLQGHDRIVHGHMPSES